MSSLKEKAAKWGRLSASAPYTSPSGRLAYVDAGKCFALLCMVIGHTEASQCTDFIDNARLPFFWLMAGFTSRPSFSLSKRFRVLMRGYVIMTIICLLASLLLLRLPFSADSLWGILYARARLYSTSFIDSASGVEQVSLMEYSNSVLWFLPSLVTGYALFKLILAITNRWIRLGACVGSLVVLQFLMKCPILLPWSIDIAFFVAPMMMAGYWLRESKWMERYPVYCAVLGLATYALLNPAVGFTNYSLREFGNLAPWGAFACSLPGGIGLAAIFRMLDNTSPIRFMAHLDLEALYIFGLQLVFFGISFAIASRLGWNLPSLVVLQLTLAVAGGYVTGKIFRNNSLLSKI